MAKSKHIGKFYKTGHNSVTEYWPHWARETVVPEVIAELQNVITFLQAVVKENE